MGEEESASEKGVHIITNNTLTWSNANTCNLVFSSGSMKMLYVGKEMIAHLDGTGDKMQWSDGDVWIRAGLDGLWKESSSGIVHTISGSTLSTVLKSGEEK